MMKTNRKHQPKCKCTSAKASYNNTRGKIGKISIGLPHALSDSKNVVKIMRAWERKSTERNVGLGCETDNKDILKLFSESIQGEVVILITENTWRVYAFVLKLSLGDEEVFFFSCSSCAISCALCTRHLTGKNSNLSRISCIKVMRFVWEK